MAEKQKKLSFRPPGSIRKPWWGWALLVIGMIWFSGCCVDFEDPGLGTVYSVGNTFTDSGATITVKAFQWSNNIWTNNGNAEVINLNCAGGSGQEIRVNNVNLAFDFGGPKAGLTLLFSERGGNVNIEVNGDFRNVGNFNNVVSPIGGVNFVCTGAGCTGGGQGSIKLTGNINSFRIGGQEFCIDNVCPK
ncbi:MAG: hypothetical protein JSV88_05470 [Candidatus Aminicenantes bacterium]|nr:MAG: hypothetical protein JSV88_05470 [Candidatus Aminicenantes bacterium]